MNGVSISTTIFAPKGMEVMPLEASLDALADANYKLIEISRNHSINLKTKDEVARRGLRIWAVHGGLDYGAVSTDAEKRRQAVAMEITRMENASAFAPCPYVVHYLNRTYDPAAGTAYRQSVQELLGRSSALGFNLSVETVPDKVENDRYPNSREIAEFARSFRASLLSVCVDVNHSNIGENLNQVALNCKGLVANIHVSDNNGFIEEHLPPGEGCIDLPAAIRSLAQAGYKGPLNMECHLPTYPSLSDLIRMREWAERTLGAPRVRLAESH